ncbi:conserved hypothetical protein [Arcobacter nitrofigilis DSM 7299]|uniref:Uncharacterized protein n=1 Tax=Arcobacter nitrofigilis (strain ATCC 33309 / DSM 7299 / CCUG 15893 / LMG 7604 / NCTC 12251 / CI) TaxID=572480 RepID=D5V079_ARCNC|nr:hypothetical protein [Arcobacter nitrofigilis]ADG93691.1 conserved hypothetical protein [Arcobacter nitrofigilis DSM 7299]
MVDSKIIEAFHLMWGNFPEPATLVHKSKEVIATNAACKVVGLEKGMNCATHGAPEAHKGCLANKALRSQEATFKKAKYAEKEIISYWLPVDGYPELFIHFGVGATINYNTIPDKGSMYKVAL